MTLFSVTTMFESALSVSECLDVMEESYREQAESRAVNRPTCHSYLPHSLPNPLIVSNRSTAAWANTASGVAGHLRRGSGTESAAPIRLEKLPLAGKGMFVGLVQLFSAETGELLAIMPDGLIQQTRVGVTSALGMKVMARQDSRSFGLDRFAAGRQKRTIVS